MVIQDTRRPDRQIVVGDTVNFPEPPRADVVWKLFDTYKEYYRNFHSNCAQEDRFYFGQNKVPIPNDMAIDPVKPATAFAIINVAADHVDISNPSIRVPEPSPRAKDRAERIQKFLQGAWMQIDEKVLRTTVRQSFLYGIAWEKVMWDSDQWPDAPHRIFFSSDGEYKDALREFQQERNVAFPFAVKNVNPQNLIWDDSRVGPKWAIEYYESTVGDVQKLYPEFQPLSKRSTDIVHFLEYWDGIWMGRMVDHEWVMRPVEHNYGFMAYVPIIPGTSIDWDVGKPERRFRGLLRPVHNLLNTEARLMTQYEAILRQYAWPTLDFVGNRMQAESTSEAYTIFGGKNIVLPGVEVKASERPTPPQEILQQLSIVRSAIEEATFPNVVRGMRPTGISSGFGVSVLAGAGRLVFGPYASGMAMAMQTMNRNFLKLIENKALGKVTVRARGEVHNFDQAIGPDDIRGFYENMVTLKAESPEEREREAVLAERLVNARIPLISQIEGMRRAGVVNPLEELNQIAAETMLNLIRPEQAAQLAQELQGQLASAAGGQQGGQLTGNQFSPGLPQLQRPGESNLQQARIASQAGQPSVFPQGQGGVNLLGQLFSGATGGANRVPSGQTTR